MKRVTFALVVAMASAAASVGVADESMAGHPPSAKATEASCGQMIAGMAPIPAKLSEGARSVAEMLEAHAALMGKDKDSLAEVKGLRAIAKTHKQLAASLLKASEEMKKASTWPASPHDMAKMTSDPKMLAANKKVIEVHKELIAMFQKMVADMEGHAKAPK